MLGQYLMPVTVRSIAGQMPAALAAKACVRLELCDRWAPVDWQLYVLICRILERPGP
jgi:hypothetical protein